MLGLPRGQTSWGWRYLSTRAGRFRFVWATDERSVGILLCFLADVLWSRAALRRSRKVYVSDSRRRGRVSRARSLFRARRSLETCSDLQEIGIHHSDPEHQGGHVLRCVYLVLHESVTMRRRRGLPLLGDSDAHHCRGGARGLRDSQVCSSDFGSLSVRRTSGTP